jgi:hypothetical protein
MEHFFQLAFGRQKFAHLTLSGHNFFSERRDHFIKTLLKLFSARPFFHSIPPQSPYIFLPSI